MKLPITAEEWVYLSHSWGPSCPPYGGQGHIQLNKIRSMDKGNSSNSLEIIGGNHTGTHFDFPLHFSKIGKNVLHYTPDFFFHTKIAVFWLETQPGSLITTNELELALRKYKGNFDDTIGLIRSGASLYRNERQFWENGPGLSLGVADFIRSTFKKMTTIGIDTISITSFQNRELGRSVHREFLCDPTPLLLIEDMNLEPLRNKNISLLIAAPLRLEDGDGAPCTVIARL